MFNINLDYFILGFVNWRGNVKSTCFFGGLIEFYTLLMLIIHLDFSQGYPASKNCFVYDCFQIKRLLATITLFFFNCDFTRKSYECRFFKISQKDAYRGRKSSEKDLNLYRGPKKTPLEPKRAHMVTVGPILFLDAWYLKKFNKPVNIIKHVWPNIVKFNHREHGPRMWFWYKYLIITIIDSLLMYLHSTNI